MSRQAPSNKRRNTAAAIATPRAQRGSAIVFATVALVAMIVSVLLGLNIGRLYYAQRDLQKLATMGALAAVESAVGCGNNPANLRTTDYARSQAVAIMQANLPSGSTANVQQMLTTINNIAGVQLGMESTSGVNPGTGASDGYYHFIPLADGNSKIDAAVVNLTEPAPALIGAAFFPGYGPIELRASATAMQQPLGSFTLGSTLANINTADSALLNPLLSALLGTSLNLSALDYQNLAGVQLSLANLEVAAGVNDLNSLLALNTNLPGVQQLLAAATAQVNPGVANLVSGLTLGATNAGPNFPLGQLLGAVGDGLNPVVTDAASLVPSLDLLDLLKGAGEAALGNSPNSFVTLSGTPSIGGLNTYVFLSVQQPPQLSNAGLNFGYGPVGTTAHTAQITLSVRANVDTTGATGFSLVGVVLNLVNGLLGLLGSSLTIAPINIGLDLKVASATGTLESISCPVSSGSGPSATIGLQTAAVTLALGGFTGNVKTDPPLATLPVNLLSIQGSGLLSAVSATIGLKTGEVSTQLDPNNATAGPFTIYGTPYQPPAIAKTSPQTWIFPACNSLGAANPSQCGNTIDPSNPQTPVSPIDLTAGLSTLIGNLTASNNLQIVVAHGIDLSSVLDPLASGLNTLLIGPLTMVLDSILSPLLHLLGVQIASSTVLMNGVETGKQVIVNTNLPGSPNF